VERYEVTRKRRIRVLQGVNRSKDGAVTKSWQNMRANGMQDDTQQQEAPDGTGHLHKKKESV
jgi:hypothetical protein